MRFRVVRSPILPERRKTLPQARASATPAIELPQNKNADYGHEKIGEKTKHRGLLQRFQYLRTMDCIFCKIASGSVPADLLHQDEQVIAFRDLHPQAPVHFLVIPRAHVQSLAHIAHEHAPLLGHLLSIAADLAAGEGLRQGFRTVINAGE